MVGEVSEVELVGSRGDALGVLVKSGGKWQWRPPAGPWCYDAIGLREIAFECDRRNRRPAGKRNPAASSQLRKVASPRRYCDASKNSFCNGVNCWWPKVPCKWRKPATIA